MAGGQAERDKDLGNHRGLFDGSDDFHRATTVETLVDIEYPFKQASPADAVRIRWMGYVTVLS